MSAPSISVVIPVKNDADHLRRCLASLVPQLDEADELVIVDNGSSDDSGAVARAAGAVVVFVLGGGIPAASSAGYDAATKTLIARLDADCVPSNDWLETIRTEFSERPETVAITGFAHFTDGPSLLRLPLSLAYLGAYYLSLFPALAHVPLFGSNCSFRRDAWVAVRDEVHRGDERVHDDMDLSFHLRSDHAIRFSRRLSMGVSMRPLFNPFAFAVRFGRGVHTVRIHWPEHVPWVRWISKHFPARTKSPHTTAQP